VIDVDVHGAGDDILAAAEAEVGAENVQQHQDNDDQQHDSEHAPAAAAARFHYRSMFAFDVVAIVGHWKLSHVCSVVAAERAGERAVPCVEGKGMNRWRWSCVTMLALAACSRTGER